uniref:Large polyvalent protein associated domain-containing protein n=2 Tax=viral metagenome TaxID=1070528 RepID=A0A6M3KFE0_9ZZZZ
MSSDGELLDSGYVGAGPTRVGKKTGFEKRRWFTTAKEALDEGYKYLPDDEALALNVRAAYNRVADKQMSEWLLTQVPWRTTGAPEELVLAAESAKMRLNRSLQLAAAINRAVRGERVPDATLNSIARVYPEEALELKLAIPEIQAGKPTAESIQLLTKKAKALIKSDRADWNAAVNARARAREKAMAPGFGEAMIMHPAFSGKIFTGPEAKELADTMRKALDPQVSRALGAVNKVNALVRYFKLAGDFSPLAIQLIFLAGQNPKIYGGAAFSIPQLLFDPEFQAKFLSKNKAVIDRHPGLLLSTSGTEFTEAMAKGGMLSSRINILPRQESFLKNLGLLAPRVIGKAGATVLEPFQRVFEGTLDYAGIKMAEALEHLAKTPAEMAEVDQFINEFRGLTSSAKLGVSPNWRAAETATLLAPRYNRAIAALLSDAVKGGITFGQSGIRNRLAIQGLTKGIAAISAIAVVISLALGEDENEIREHFDPNSSRFFTWNIEGTNVGPGTKVRSVVKLIAQSADNPGALFQNGMENPALRFIRGNLAPVLGSSVNLLTGTNYIGDPVRSDVSTFTKEMLVKNFLPIWVENVAYEGGTLSQKLIRGSGEFFGGRAYPETISEQVGRLRDRYAAKEYGEEYESLNNSQRDALRQKYDDLAIMEKESKVYYAERGNAIERFYFNEKQRITDERNNGLEKAAQAYLDGKITKYDYDKQRGYIRPYYSGGSEVLWSAKESLDEYSVEQMEKWLDENIKPEDKALGEYQEYRAGLIEGADLPVDWDIIERELEDYLTKYPPDIQAYIIANTDNWINDLPPAAKQVEQERASGIEDETWWDDYRGKSLPKINTPYLYETQKPNQSYKDILSGTTPQPTYTPKQTYKDVLKVK